MNKIITACKTSIYLPYRVTIIISVVLLYLFNPNAQIVYSSINQAFTYQGKIVSDDGLNLTGSEASCIQSGADTCDFRVSIYTASSGGTLVWRETKSNVEIGDNDGIFNLLLDCGGTWASCEQNGGPDFTTGMLYIEVDFDPDGDGDFAEGETFTPRRVMTSVPYAFNAENSEALGGESAASYLRSNANDTLENTYTLTVEGILDITGTFDIDGVTVNSTAAELNYLDTATVISGGLIFANGTNFTQDVANFFWNDSSNFLGIGTSAPSTALDVQGQIQAGSSNVTLTLSTGYIDADSLTLFSGANGVGVDTSASGLEVQSDGLTLLQGCDDEEILKWYENTDTWVCSADVSGSGGITDLQEAYEGGNTIQLSAAFGNFRIFNDGGNEGIFIEETTGNLGLGNTAPTTKLNVSGNFDIEGYGAIGNGSSISANSGLIIDYDATYGNVGQQLLVTGTSTGAASNNVYGARIDPEGITVPSGTTNLVASLSIDEPSITATGTLTNSAALYIAAAATEAINNYSIWVDSGSVRLDETLAVSGTSTLAGLESSGDWTWSATTPQITINSGEALTITDGTDSFIVNTTGSFISITDATNAITFDVDTGPVYTGTARPLRQITLSPEFEGATITGDGSNNTGTLTSDFCEQGASADIPNTNTTVCNTSGDIHNYYSWTTAEGSVQDYDIWIRWRIPDNFSTWSSSNPIYVYGKRTDATNNAITVYVYDTAGNLENSGGTQVAGTTWTQTSVETTFAGTYTSGQYMTIRIVLAADTGGDSVQVGEISLDYLSDN